jgi:hypothetical protein
MAPRTITHRKNKRLNAYNLLHEQHYKTKRDRKDIDLDVIKSLAQIGATREEISIIIGCSTTWLSKEIDQNPAMANAIESGIGELKTSLRRTQVQMALSGNVPLLIWLGKQCLGQSDKHEQNNKTEINVTVQRATEELRNIPRGQLLEALRVMEAPVIENDSASETIIVPEAE